MWNYSCRYEKCDPCPPGIYPQIRHMQNQQKRENEHIYIHTYIFSKLFLRIMTNVNKIGQSDMKEDNMGGESSH